MENPYKDLSDKFFWKKAVSEINFFDLDSLWNPIDLNNKKISTAGSCFAQHLSRALKTNGFNFVDYELPDKLFPKDQYSKFGYNLYSCRYGNIYTVSQLLQLVLEAFDNWKPKDLIWEKNGRFFDSLRPNTTPVGYSSKDDLIKNRNNHLKSVKKMFEDTDVFIFTLGLTEAWVLEDESMVFATAPGVIANVTGEYRYKFKNYKCSEIVNDLKKFIKLTKSFNKNLQFIFTVSPVPLIATASNDHVLLATSYSKSVLRSAAGEVSKDFDFVYYFPSYEIISSIPNRGMFFEPNLRAVNQKGVEFVMKHFFQSDNMNEQNKIDLICDEEKNE